jgi:cell division septation protein DedD
MTKTLDVYRDWLKIAETARPLNHYQLLRLKQFEDNPAKVREHYRAMNAHVRKYAAGEFAKQSQDLLNELARAMLCLTDARRKGDYDATLGRKDTSDGKRRSFEQILLATKVVDQAALDKARNFAKAINVEVRDALVQQRLAKYEAVLPAYAESIGLPYIDLRDIPLNRTLISQVPPQMARQHSCVPVMVDDKQLLMASPNMLDPNVEEELRLRFNMPVRTVLCSPSNIDEVITKYVPKDGSAAPPPPVAAEPVAAAAGAPAAAAPAAAAAPVSPEEAKKQQRDQALIAFVISWWVTIGAGKFGLGWGWLTAGITAAAVAAVVGGVVWKMKSR